MDNKLSRRALLGVAFTGAVLTLSGCNTTSTSPSAQPKKSAKQKTNKKADLSFAPAHEKYAYAVMVQHAQKRLGQTQSSIRSEQKASYDWSVEQDMLARSTETGYGPSWSTATANSINDAIKSAAIKAVDKYMDRKNASLDVDQVVKHAGLALPAIMATAANDDAATTVKSIFSKRALLGTVVSVFGFLAMTKSASAKNGGYIGKVKSGAQSYTNTNAPRASNQAGAGVRADRIAEKTYDIA